MLSIHEEHEKSTISSKRLIFVFLIQIFLFLILLIRLFCLQIFNYEKYKTLSEENRIKTFIIPPLRGHIFDRNNIQLTDNQKNYRVLFYKDKSEEKNMETLLKVSKILDLTENEFNKILKKMENNYGKPIITILDNVSWKDLVKLQANSYDLDGIMIEEGYIRYYPYSSTFAHIIGYVNNPTKEEIDIQNSYKERELLLHPDYKIGRTGLEKVFNENIMGENGYRQLEMNALSIPIREIKVENATEGDNIKLTIDFNLQRFIKSRMQDVRGSAIVMNVWTGEILALVSMPSYNNNRFVEGISNQYWTKLSTDEGKPLSNKAISATYPPGSTFKLITAMSALENGWQGDKEIDCNGKLALNKKRTMHCWMEKGHGKINLVEAIKDSCNIYFTKLGLFAGIDNIYKTAKDFGLGEKYNLKLLNIKTGTIPNREWKKKVFNDVWVSGDTVNVAIGQGFLSVTPLELAVMTSRIANGGYKIRPYLIYDSKMSQYNEELFTRLPMVKKETIDIVKQGMYDVVNTKGGTAYWTRIKQKGFEMAGKTGTAQVIAKEKKDIMEEENEKIETKFQNHGLFIAFAPYEKPRYAVVVVVEHGNSGSGVAAPIAKDILLYAQKNKIGYDD